MGGFVSYLRNVHHITATALGCGTSTADESDDGQVMEDLLSPRTPLLHGGDGEPQQRYQTVVKAVKEHHTKQNLPFMLYFKNIM
jgi:hypothetical protein